MDAQAQKAKKRRGAHFAQNLLYLMKSLGFTQDLLAEELGISQGAVSNYLGGRIPRPDMLFALSNHFRIPVSDLLHKDMTSEPGAAEVAKVPDSVIRRRTSYERLLERFEGLSDAESERWAKVFLKMLDELGDRK
jgi:transcriptional regulator with XRE-family HTH domain